MTISVLSFIGGLIVGIWVGFVSKSIWGIPTWTKVKKDEIEYLPLGDPDKLVDKYWQETKVKPTIEIIKKNKKDVIDEVLEHDNSGTIV